MPELSPVDYAVPGFLLLIGGSLWVLRPFLGALVWATLFTALGYVGGEVIAPWLHSLDQHLKHWIWLALAVGFVALLRYGFKRRQRKNPHS